MVTPTRPTKVWTARNLVPSAGCAAFHVCERVQFLHGRKEVLDGAYKWKFLENLDHGGEGVE